ncbi:MAG: hypothetical protein M9924_22075 [Rhizobiaceae bacterium]|nr:hypothetical protein [Rhizobiaceae bacterium]
MPNYLITWEIGPEQFADPVEAARWAWEQMRAPGSIANVFQITDESGVVHQVDLQEIDEIPVGSIASAPTDEVDAR